MLKKLVVMGALAASPVMAQDKEFSLQVPEALTVTGIVKHILPRFSLKTGVRITLVPGEADASFGAQGVPVFRQDNQLWHFAQKGSADAERFQDWLLSEVGKRTIESFAPQGVALFSADVDVQTPVEMITLDGDTVLGEAASLKKCGRCHVVNDTNRMSAIGSTPSFALLRTFPDWQERFETFFMLRPHPAFTQVADITAPFAENLPSPIAPIEVTWDEIEAITAYVGSIQPADLGAPLHTQ